jgi:hypothetical protein
MRFLLVLIGLLVMLVLGPISVFADSVAPPRSYIVFSPNHEYIFVMIAPLTPEQEAAGYEERYAAQIRKIRQTYHVSGLYRNNGATSPLWTVDWYAYHVEIASNGIHLVRSSSVAMTPNDEAIVFFANGHIIRSYSVADLVDLSWFMPRSVSHVLWRADGRLDTTAMTYTIWTKHGERLVFDVTTGRMTQAWRPVRLIGGGIGIASVLLLMWKLRLTRKT